MEAFVKALMRLNLEEVSAVEGRGPHPVNCTMAHSFHIPYMQQKKLSI